MSGDGGAWHDPYDGLFPEVGPQYTGLERRFLVLSIIARLCEDADFIAACESLAERVDAGEADAEGALLKEEERWLSILEHRLELEALPELHELPEPPAELQLIRNRLRALVCVARLQGDGPGEEQTRGLAAQIRDGLPHSFEPTLLAADEDLTGREELLLEILTEE